MKHLHVSHLFSPHSHPLTGETIRLAPFFLLPLFSLSPRPYSHTLFASSSYSLFLFIFHPCLFTFSSSSSLINSFPQFFISFHLFLSSILFLFFLLFFYIFIAYFYLLPSSPFYFLRYLPFIFLFLPIHLFIFLTHPIFFTFSFPFHFFLITYFGGIFLLTP